MGRDLSIWNQLVSEGNDPETINGAITTVRQVTGISGPITLAIFYGRGGKTRPIFEQSKTRWLDSQRGGSQRFKDILRQLADA